MRMAVGPLFLFAASFLSPKAFASCSIDVTRDFFSNFDNPCYVITPPTGDGHNLSGDLNANYDLTFYKVDPNYELILYGDYPQARYFAVTTYDDHGALLASISDAQIQPLTANERNPFRPSVPWAPEQRWAVAISLGGQQPPPQNILPGCSLNGFTVHANQIRGFGRHAGMSWGGDPNLPWAFPAHSTSPSKGGVIIVRRYLEDDAHAEPAKILVRDLRTGCAVPAATATNQWVTSDRRYAKDYAADAQQTDAHARYAQRIQERMCYGRDPNSVLYWTRNAEYVRGDNAEAAYLLAPIASSVRSKLGALFNKHYLRIRFRLPRTPQLPCAGCTLAGNEEQRYWSLSVLDGGQTLASLSDRDVVSDANGYATVVIGAGPAPAQVTAANGYTYVDAAGLVGSMKATFLALRSILPEAGAACAANRIPFVHSEHNSLGGAMGEYGLTTDLLKASDFPALATPYPQPNSCGLVPPEIPTACSEFYESPNALDLANMLL